MEKKCIIEYLRSNERDKKRMEGVKIRKKSHHFSEIAIVIELLIKMSKPMSSPETVDRMQEKSTIAYTLDTCNNNDDQLIAMAGKARLSATVV